MMLDAIIIIIIAELCGSYFEKIQNISDVKLKYDDVKETETVYYCDFLANVHKYLLIKKSLGSCNMLQPFALFEHHRGYIIL